MRAFFLLLCVAALSLSSTAHADTIIDNFTYTYTISGATYTHTFSLVDGQTPNVYARPGGSQTPEYVYTNVEFDNDPASLYSVTFKPLSAEYAPDGITNKFNVGTDFIVTPSSNPSLYDESSTIFAVATDTGTGTGLTFKPSFNPFILGAIVLGPVSTDDVFFSSSSLTIAQVHVADPPPVTGPPIPSPSPSPLTSPVPEPSSLVLLSTGLLGVANVVRRRVLIG